MHPSRKPRELRAVAPSQDVPSAWARARERSCGAQDDASRSFLSGAFLPLGVHPEAFHFAEKWNAEPHAAGAPAKLRGLSDWSSGCPLRIHLALQSTHTLRRSCLFASISPRGHVDIQAARGGPASPSSSASAYSSLSNDFRRRARS